MGTEKSIFGQDDVSRYQRFIHTQDCASVKIPAAVREQTKAQMMQADTLNKPGPIVIYDPLIVANFALLAETKPPTKAPSGSA